MWEFALAFLPFAFSTSITPGPNNIMLASSGATFGFVRTLRHLLGVALGFSFMVLLLGLGLAELFKSDPRIHELVRYLGAAYLFYLAWRIAGSAPPANNDGTRGTGKPLSFLEAALFQWVNPKAWSMAIGAISAFTTVGGEQRLEVAILAATFCAVGLISSSAWTVLGVGVGQLIQSRPQWLRVFNLIMAALLVASIVPFFI